MIESGPRGLLLLMIALVAIENHRFVQSQEQQLVAPETNLTYVARNLGNHLGPEHHLKSNRQVAGQNSSTSETLETAPTITSVHQVWTSSSSGRLDELSPEMISKLRQDVPFLAAYALRPRLVGASPAPLISHLQAVAAPEAGRLDVAASSNGDPKVAMAVAASSARQQLDGRSPLAGKLATGDFSEYNEETSSLSKSEHHHRRRTSVKRARPETPSDSNSEDGPLEFSSSSLRRRRVSSGRDKNNGDSLKQLVNRLKQRSSGGKARALSKTNKVQRAASGKGGRTGKGSESRRRRRRLRSRSNKGRKAKASRQRRASKKVSSTPKSGRLLQASSSANGERAATGGDVKGGGGGGGGTRKPPFYASTRPDQTKGSSKDDEATAATKSPTNAIDDHDDDKVDSQPEVVGANTPDDAEIDAEPREVEPKRVGDDDVEEDIGDTVLVEPKSDGVDDDPPLPDSPLPDDDAEDDDDARGGSSPGTGSEGGDKAPESSGDREKEVTTPMPKLAPEGDPRGNRVNRQKPNQPPVDDKTTGDGGESDSDGDNSGNGGGGSQVAGGGIGTTLGGGGSGGDSGASESGDDDNRSGGSGGGGGTRGGDGSAGVTPGVEFAGDRDSDDERASTSGRDGTDAGGGRSSGGGATGGSGDGGQFGDRRQSGSGGAAGANGGRGGDSGGGSAPDDKDDDDDLDYRDEMAEAERKGTGGKVPTATATGGHSGDNGHNQDGKGAGGHGKPATSGGDHSTAGHGHGHGHGHHDCDDGSYNHGGGHHDHHDTIEWLRGAIPGEPDDDYPILSRVNATNFRCADQKLPGYYADVDARCQIFHICQADGRQDSFLCPNGTIFSQRTLVCVWWNGFNCEDAPKYYHLNELLYKTTNGDESPQAAALPEAMRPLMTPLRPKGVRAREEDNDDADDASMMASLEPSDDGDDTSPIDGLVRAMRGRGGGESTARDATGTAIGGPAAPGTSAGANRAVSQGDQDEAGVSRGHSNAVGPRRNLDDEDEATIQRKSTSTDEDDADEPPARLRARDNIRRRRRRASTRQAPPKLKSRRVSRNSRRRKLRHGVKPRRRA